MTGPRQQQSSERRRTDAEKVLVVVDTIMIVVRALLGLFGRRRVDEYDRRGSV